MSSENIGDLKRRKMAIAFSRISENI